MAIGLVTDEHMFALHSAVHDMHYVGVVVD